jgi:hypothetical protein
LPWCASLPSQVCMIVYLPLVNYDPGDSLTRRDTYTDSKLKPLRTRLRAWLGRLFGGTFEDQGNSLPIGLQQDGNSCGICVLNAMEHAVFGVPLFRHEGRLGLHVRYFVAMTKYALGEVGGSLSWFQWLTVELTPPLPSRWTPYMRTPHCQALHSSSQPPLTPVN